MIKIKTAQLEEYLLCYVPLVVYGSEVSQDQFGGFRFPWSTLPTETSTQEQEF